MLDEPTFGRRTPLVAPHYYVVCGALYQLGWGGEGGGPQSICGAVAESADDPDSLPTIDP